MVSISELVFKRPAPPAGVPSAEVTIAGMAGGIGVYTASRVSAFVKTGTLPKTAYVPMITTAVKVGAGANIGRVVGKKLRDAGVTKVADGKLAVVAGAVITDCSTAVIGAAFMSAISPATFSPSAVMASLPPVAVIAGTRNLLIGTLRPYIAKSTGLMPTDIRVTAATGALAGAGAGATKSLVFDKGRGIVFSAFAVGLAVSTSLVVQQAVFGALTRERDEKK